MSDHTRLRIAALLVVLALVVGCGGSEPVQETAPVARPVKLLVVGDGEAATEKSFPGSVAAGDQVDLAFRVGGPLIELPVNEGEQVRRGQVVARIDPRDFQIRVDSAQAQFDKAQADFERLTALYEKEAVSKAQLDQTRSARDVAEAALEDARANLSDTRLRAPFGASVGAKFVSNFEEVQPQQPVLSLVGVDTVEIQVDLPESIVARIRLGETDDSEIFARFEAAPGRDFPLELKELAMQADPQTQTYRATLVMPQPDGVNILPGMTAEVVGRRPHGADAGLPVSVPAVAVVPDDAGGAQVWVVDTEAMTVHRRAVTTGSLVGADRIEILDGLASGETIAISAVSRLHEAMPIRPLDQ